jgi:hypothetical protein
MRTGACTAEAHRAGPSPMSLNAHAQLTSSPRHPRAATRRWQTPAPTRGHGRARMGKGPQADARAHARKQRLAAGSNSNARMPARTHARTHARPQALRRHPTRGRARAAASGCSTSPGSCGDGDRGDDHDACALRVGMCLCPCGRSQIRYLRCIRIGARPPCQQHEAIMQRRG